MSNAIFYVIGFCVTFLAIGIMDTMIRCRSIAR